MGDRSKKPNKQRKDSVSTMDFLSQHYAFVDAKDFGFLKQKLLPLSKTIEHVADLQSTALSRLVNRPVFLGRTKI